jgi:hypothetical protein
MLTGARKAGQGQMLYLKLSHGGVVELPSGETAEREEEQLVVRALDGRVVCRIDRHDVLAFSRRRDILEGQEAPERED